MERPRKKLGSGVQGSRGLTPPGMKYPSKVSPSGGTSLGILLTMPYESLKQKLAHRQGSRKRLTGSHLMETYLWVSFTTPVR